MKTALTFTLLLAMTFAALPAEDTLNVLATFTEYQNAGSSLTQAKDGNFYLTNAQGNVWGTISKLTPQGSLTVLEQCSFGNRFPSPLLQGQDGNFYGTTFDGGTTDGGTFFKISPDGTFSTLSSFNGTNGRNPTDSFTSLTESNGVFYGTTLNGGTSQNGNLYEVTPSGDITTLYSFDGTNGLLRPYNLVLSSDGNFYGTAGANVQSIFKITPTGVLNTLFSTAGTHANALGHFTSFGSFIQGADGNFYGTTQDGGPSKVGSIFKITPQGVIKVLYSFKATIGIDPIDLIQGTDGNFYGITKSGGKYNDGTIFKITPQGSLTTILTFNGTNGSEPQDLIQGRDSNLYGTLGYGANGASEVFQLVLPNPQPIALENFNPNNYALGSGLSGNPAVPGFTGSWLVTSGTNAVGTLLAGSLTYPGVISSGNTLFATNGQPATNPTDTNPADSGTWIAERFLDTTGVFAPYTAPNGNIGLSGVTLYAGFLLKLKTQPTALFESIELGSGDEPTDTRLFIGYAPLINQNTFTAYVGNQGATGTFGYSALGALNQGQTNFFVIRMQFSDSGDSVSIYQNSTTEVNPKFIFSTQGLSINNLKIVRAGVGTGSLEVGSIKFGPTYASVVGSIPK